MERTGRVELCTNKEWMKSAAWHRYKIRLGEWILELSRQKMKFNRYESFDVSMGCWIVWEKLLRHGCTNNVNGG